MASNIDINLNARTTDFETALDRVNSKFEKLAYQGKDSGKSVETAFKSLNNSATELQKSFNALSIKTDFSMEVQKEAMVSAKHFFLQQFLEIKNSGQASANEVARAWQGMQDKLASLNGTASSKMMDEAIMLNQKFNYDKIRADEKMYAEAKMLNQKFDFDKLRTDASMYSEAIMLNQKFNYDKIRLKEQEVASLKRLQAEEMSSYARQGMTGQGAAAALIGQNHAGSDFGKQLKAQMEDVAQSTKKLPEHMNLFGLASVAAIAKIQIMYSLINTVMSAIGSAPGIAIDAIESYNASVVGNAAMITSMQTGVRDVGKAYQENKKYAEAVESVLLKMDAETAASAKNLRDMNTQFVQQGILIDTNKAKQVEGFKSIANALAAITSNDPNQAMQFAQEIRALRSFEDKGSNRLVQMLTAQGVTKEMFNQWKASDTVLEEMGKRLQGFAAAQGDINNLWATVKSTMETVRDAVLREGLAPAFKEIVEFMKQISTGATENKEAIINGMNKGILVTKGLIESVVGLFKILQPILAPVVNVVGMIFNGWGMIAAVALPTVIEKLLSIVTISRGLSDVITSLLKGHWDEMKASAKSVSSEFGNLFDLSSFDNRMNAWNSKISIPNGVAGVTKPSGVKTAVKPEKMVADPAVALWNTFQNQYENLRIKAEPDTYEKKLMAADKQREDILSSYANTMPIKQKAELEAGAAEKGTSVINWINELTEAVKKNITESEQLKANPIIDMFNQSIDKSGENPLTRLLSDISAKAEKVKTSIANASSEVKAFLTKQGVTSETVDENFGAWGDRVKGDDDAKRAKEALKLQTDSNKIKNSIPFSIFGGTNEHETLKRNFDEQIEAQDLAIKTAFDNYTLDENQYEAHLQIKKNLTDKYKADQLVTQTKYDQSMVQSQFDAANKAMNIMVSASENSKSMQLAALAIQTAIAVGQIQIAGRVAQMMALAQLGPIAGAVAAGQIEAMMWINTGLTIAAGVISAGSIAGKREFGGPVNAGQSYIVGEKRPELFTPGASGVITPYVPKGGSEQSITVVNQINAGIQGTVQSELARFMPTIVRNTVSAVQSAINSGTSLSAAVGRM